jgi:adenosine kinase
MTFAGRFADSLVVEQLSKISLSFLTDDLQVRRGGCAANISFGMANLGQQPVLVGAVGEDFADYRSWLERHGVDCDSIHVSGTLHTARFVCTTDRDMAQIATFYAGAMSEARQIELGPVADRLGGLDLVLVGPNDPEAMLRHTDECRSRGIPFAADPSQQLARMEGEPIKRLIEGAAYLFTNEYESHLITQKTGWTEDEILGHVGVQVTTLGAHGVRVRRSGDPDIHVGVAKPRSAKVDPTGVGDAFRSGFLTGVVADLDVVHASQVGSLLAMHVLETVGTQEYRLGTRRFLDRLAESYGQASADAIAPHIRCPNP